LTFLSNNGKINHNQGKDLIMIRDALIDQIKKCRKSPILCRVANSDDVAYVPTTKAGLIKMLTWSYAADAETKFTLDKDGFFGPDYGIIEDFSWLVKK
jgi:hypothetical protein